MAKSVIQSSLVSIFLCLPLSFLFAQHPIFYFSGNGPLELTDYQIDDEGNHYCVGELAGDSLWFRDSLIMLDQGFKGRFGTVQPDMFMCKVNAEGDLVYVKNGWAQGSLAGGDDGRVEPQKLAIDESGNAIVSGFLTYDTLNFGGQVWPLDTMAGANLFVLKMDSTGQVLWLKNMKVQRWLTGPGTKDGSARMAGIAVDENDNIVLTGDYWLQLIVESDTLSYVYASPHDVNSFIIRLSPQGNLIWSRGLIAVDFTYCSGVAYDGNGAYYAIGSFLSNTLVIGSDTLVSDGEHAEVYITKFDEQGNFLWAHQGFDPPNEDYPTAITADAAGNAYMLGNYEGWAIQFEDSILWTSASAWNIFLVKYSPAGKLLWARSADGPFAQFGLSMTFDGQENLVFGGDFQSDTLAFGAHSMIRKNPVEDSYVAGIDKSGHFLAAQNYKDLHLEALRWSAINTVYVSGYFSGSITFNNNQIINAPGKSALFFAPLEELAVSLPEQPNQQNISVFPNPFRNQFKVTLQYDVPLKEVKLHLYDATGKLLSSYEAEGASNEYICSAPDLAPGIYHLHLLHQGKLIGFEKLVKF